MNNKKNSDFSRRLLFKDVRKQENQSEIK